MLDFTKIPKFNLKWNYKKGKIEKWFQSEITTKLRNLWYITFHPSDIWLANKFLDLHLIDISWKIPEFWWIEFKKIQKDSFNVKQFEDWQIELLNILWPTAQVWIYSVKHNDYKIFDFRELWDRQNDKWWIKIFSNK
jgi:hypothetical protein